MSVANNKKALIYNASVQPFIQKACNLIATKLGLPHFGYIKNFKDGSYIYLCSSQSWLEHHCDNVNREVAEFADIKRTKLLNGMSYYSWPQNKEREVFRDFYEFNIWNGIELCYKCDDYIENFYFAGTRTQEIENTFYLENIEILKFFTFYFRSICSNILEQAHSNKLIPEKSFPSFFDLCQFSQNTKSSISFNSLFPIKKFYLDGHLSNVYLSIRELECLSLLGKGYSVKQIALHVGISSKTVNSYIDRIRIKTGINSTSQLVFLYHSSSLKHLDLSEITSSDPIAKIR